MFGASDDKAAGRRAPRPGAVARYALVWITLGAVIAAAALLVLDEPAQETTLPPVQQTELVRAARAADCQLQRARTGERLDPPADGPAGTAVRPGFYERQPPAEGLIAAVRRGIIVIYHLPDATRDRVAHLRALQETVPGGTIVTPYEQMRHAVAVAAYRRLLVCPRLSDVALDAIRLFRGRHIGTGPDR